MGRGVDDHSGVVQGGPGVDEAGSVSQPVPHAVARSRAETALMDAAERLLVSVGYAKITTRSVAIEAGVNHGLVHYYFGSNEKLLLQTLERYTDRLLERQRSMYASQAPFLEKWRTAMRFLTTDDVAYQKTWLELQALSWNNAEVRALLVRVNAAWREVLTDAFEEPRLALGIPMPLDALVSLVMTFNTGIIVERLGGVEEGHRELLGWIDGWLAAA